MVRSPYQSRSIELAALGVAAPDPALLETIVAKVVGDPDVRIMTALASTVDYPFTSISTAGLHRVVGTARSNGESVGWSVFVKGIQHARHWPLLHTIPPHVVPDLLANFPWRSELETRERVASVLPEGMRLPDIYYLDDRGDDRVTVWMEHIDVDTAPWSLEHYRRCAFLLGRLAARRTPDRPAGRCDLPVGFAVRKMAESRMPLLTAVLADDGMWTGAEARQLIDVEYRRDLARLHDRLPRLLDEMDTLPQALPHGDATPANLLRPRTDPDAFVAVDWSFQSPLPLGHDLGQLLVGGVEGGFVHPSLLPAIHEAIVPEYCRGLTEEGLDVAPAIVVRGYLGGLACRTAPSALPLDLVRETMSEDLLGYLRNRAAMARFVLDLVLS